MYNNYKCLYLSSSGCTQNQNGLVLIDLFYYYYFSLISLSSFFFPLHTPPIKSPVRTFGVSETAVMSIQ